MPSVNNWISRRCSDCGKLSKSSRISLISSGESMPMGFLGILGILGFHVELFDEFRAFPGDGLVVRHEHSAGFAVPFFECHIAAERMTTRAIW